MTFIHRIQNLFLYIVHYLISVFFLILVLYSIPTVLFLCMSALSCMSALCLYFLLHWKLLSSGQIPSCVCKHTCNKALLILIIVFFKCCHHVPQYMAFCWLAPRLHSIQCQMIICDYKKQHTKQKLAGTPQNTHTHTHTHTRTHVYLAIQMGTFHRRNGFYTVQTVCAIALHLPYT